MEHARALVIDPGDVGGLVALAVADRPDRLVCWHPVFDDPAGRRRRKAAAEHAVLYGVEHYEECRAAALLRSLDPATATRAAGPSGPGHRSSGQTGADQDESTSTGSGLNNSGHSSDLDQDADPPLPPSPRCAGRRTPVPGDPIPDAPGGGLGDDPIHQSILLLAAADAARRHRCEEIIWPVHHGGNFEAICDVCERLILMQQLIRDASARARDASAAAQASIAHSEIGGMSSAAVSEVDRAGSASFPTSSLASGPVLNDGSAIPPFQSLCPRRLRAPFVDFTDEQMVDLLIRGDAPVRGMWWCERGGDEPCGECDSCIRWAAAFRRAGMVLPWATGARHETRPVQSPAIG